MISNCLIRLEDYNRDFRYVNEDISERITESKNNLQNLPELMCQIFFNAEKFIAEHKVQFLSELDDIIGKQLALFKKDNETKVPNFYERLSKKYQQLQQATSNVGEMNDA